MLSQHNVLFQFDVVKAFNLFSFQRMTRPLTCTVCSVLFYSSVLFELVSLLYCGRTDIVYFQHSMKPYWCIVICSKTNNTNTTIQGGRQSEVVQVPFGTCVQACLVVSFVFVVSFLYVCMYVCTYVLSVVKSVSFLHSLLCLSVVAGWGLFECTLLHLWVLWVLLLTCTVTSDWVQPRERSCEWRYALRCILISCRFVGRYIRIHRCLPVACQSVRHGTAHLHGRCTITLSTGLPAVPQHLLSWSFYWVGPLSSYSSLNTVQERWQTVRVWLCVGFQQGRKHVKETRVCMWCWVSTMCCWPMYSAE